MHIIQVLANRINHRILKSYAILNIVAIAGNLVSCQAHTGEINSCISNYIESQNYMVNHTSMSKSHLQAIADQNASITVICNAKYSSTELSRNEVLEILRENNKSSMYGSYNFTLQDGQHDSIPVISHTLDEDFAFRLSHFVYMNQSQSIQELLDNLEKQIRNRTFKAPDTYSWVEFSY